MIKFLIVAFAVSLTFSTQTLQAQDALRLGIRADAKPFSYRTENGFEGFLYDLCKAALDRASFTVQEVVINAADREPGLRAGGNIDILCDPFTVTQARAGEFLLSQIVFVSGGSFLSSTASQDEAYLIGLDARNAAEQANRPLARTDNSPAQRIVGLCKDLGDDQIGSVRIAAVTGSTAKQIIENALKQDQPLAIKRSPYETVCIEEYATHTIAIEAFCKQEKRDGYPISYYFGDRDILIANQEGQPDCDHVTASDTFYSVEPYAIAFSADMERAAILAFQKAMLEVFSEFVTYPEKSGRTTTLPIKLFATYFEGKRMSQSLQSLFTTLIVPEGGSATP